MRGKRFLREDRKPSSELWVDVMSGVRGGLVMRGVRGGLVTRVVRVDWGLVMSGVMVGCDEWSEGRVIGDE